MCVLGNILIGLAQVLGSILWLYIWLLIGRMIISWVNADPRNAIVRFLIMATDPPMRIIRRMLPASLRYFPLDIAFLVLFGLVVFAQYAVVQSLADLGHRLRRPECYSPAPAADATAAELLSRPRDRASFCRETPGRDATETKSGAFILVFVASDPRFRDED